MMKNRRPAGWWKTPGTDPEVTRLNKILAKLAGSLCRNGIARRESPATSPDRALKSIYEGRFFLRRQL